MREFTREIGDGRQITIRLDPEDLVIGDDVAADCRQLPATFGLVSELVADLEGAAARAEAEFKTWRAIRGMELRAMDDKPAEWKVSQALNADAPTGQHKEEIADITSDLVFLRGFQDALRLKAGLLRTVVDHSRLQRELDR